MGQFSVEISARPGQLSAEINREHSRSRVELPATCMRTVRGRVELLTGLEGASSRPVRRIVLLG
jgi:hypothetical protein